MRKIFILIATALVAMACSTADKRTSDQLPPIFPDYAGVTIPVNIAPLNFDVTTPAKRVEATISNGTEQIVAKGREGVRISPRKWRLTLMTLSFMISWSSIMRTGLSDASISCAQTH